MFIKIWNNSGKNRIKEMKIGLGVSAYVFGNREDMVAPIKRIRNREIVVVTSFMFMISIIVQFLILLLL